MRTSLRTVLDAFADGARTVDDLADRTGLDPDLVRVALDQLVALRLVDSAPLAGACPDDACGGCAVSACTTRGAPVALTLSRPPAQR
jgi:hypothetical protein